LKITLFGVGWFLFFPKNKKMRLPSCLSTKSSESRVHAFFNIYVYFFKTSRENLQSNLDLSIQAIIDDEGEELTRKTIELAKDGDLIALRLCLDRICPPRKSRPFSIDLPDVKTSEGVSLAQTSVVQAVGEGEITPEEGQVLSNILESRRKSIESEDHERRLYELESRMGKVKL
jgi:hypothetical protein